MKRILLVLLFCSQTISAQVASFHSEFNTINKNLMVGLGTYAVSNFVVSGIGYLNTENEVSKRFHEMNVMWNTVNVGLAIPGYLKAINDQRSLTPAQMIKIQKKTETIFLVNDALDVAYITTGVLMRMNARNQPNRNDLFEGYGNSLILQGTFLLMFDAYAYFLHHKHASSSVLFNNVTVQALGNNVVLIISLN